MLRVGELVFFFVEMSVPKFNSIELIIFQKIVLITIDYKAANIRPLVNKYGIPDIIERTRSSLVLKPSCHNYSMKMNMQNTTSLKTLTYTKEQDIPEQDKEERYRFPIKTVNFSLSLQMVSLEQNCQRVLRN